MGVNNLREPNRCISCTYLCYLEGYTHRQLLKSSRKSIINRTLAKSLITSLRCYKNHLLDMYSGFSESTAEEDMISVFNATCPSKDWLLHQDGIPPELSLQHEQQSKSSRWNKWQWITALIGICVALVALGLAIYNAVSK